MVVLEGSSVRDGNMVSCVPDFSMLRALIIYCYIDSYIKWPHKFNYQPGITQALKARLKSFALSERR